MKLSLEWLRELVDLPEDPEQVCSTLTLLGLEVERAEPFDMAWPHVIVGHVVKAQQHPDADRLRLCRVSTGSDEVDVVCGAQNVRAGLRVALALPGAVLPGGVTIRKSKIRGQVSAGMICSERELGLGQGHEGIVELDASAPVGEPLDNLLGYHDLTIEIEVTPNRPDWLSHLGVARELGAALGRPLRAPVPTVSQELADKADGWKAVIEDPQGCPRYTGRLVRDITVGPSPQWLRRRLLSIGQRPINSVVDVSNFVLHELGHPNHVFDLAQLRGTTIVVRRARAGESLTTLDGAERALQPHHLLIADAEHPLALAGVMGGQASEVGEETKAVLIEVASFDPRAVRRARRDLTMSTDASYRFERGVDPQGVAVASARVAQLLEQVAGGRASLVGFQAWGEPFAPPARFFVRWSQVQRLLGVSVQREQARDWLKRLQIEATPGERDHQAGLQIAAPSFRPDLAEEVDVLEEIARLHGYDKVPVAKEPPMLLPAARTARERLHFKLRSGLAARGYHEVVASSFMESADPDRLGLAEGDRRRAKVEVMNPLTAEQGQLRSTALPEMLRVVGRNRRRGITGPLRFFQLARCFIASGGDPLPEEPESLVLVWDGPVQVPHASRAQRGVDLFDLLGDVEELLAALGLRCDRDLTQAERYHAAGRAVGLRADAAVVACIGELAPFVLAAFDLEGPLVCAELPLAALLPIVGKHHPFVPYSPYPPVRRDLSLVVPRGVGYGAIELQAKLVFGELLETVDLFDLYEGAGIASGARALGVRLALRSTEGTLKDRKVDALIANLLAELRSRHGIELRA